MAEVIEQVFGEGWAAYLSDCIEAMKGLPDGSVDYSIFSPPFASLYTYSDALADMGNCKTHAEFYRHFAYCVPELFRSLKPGRCLSFHCMNLPASKERDGYIGQWDFRGELIRRLQMCQSCGRHIGDHYDEDIKAETCGKYNGFYLHSEVCIWKDPVTAMQRTKAIGLLHKQIVKDSALSRQGIPDYLITMRKPGVNAEPVAGEFDRYIGEDGTGPRPASSACPTCGGTKQVMSTDSDDYGTFYRCGTCSVSGATRFSIEVWQRYASPVWMDIKPGDTLQKESAREQDDERHICPLQIQVIERAIELWTNPGDVVLSPFMGIGSEGHVAVQMQRRFIGIELKRSYWEQAVANLKVAHEANMPLFAEEMA